IATLPEVELALPGRFQRLDFRDTLVFIIALDAPNFAAADRGRGASFHGLELFPRLSEPGTVLVSDNFAALHHVRAGDRITLPGPRGPVELRVLGTMLDYSWNRGVVFMDLGFYRQQFEDPLVDVFDVFLRPGADPGAARESILRRWG